MRRVWLSVGAAVFAAGMLTACSGGDIEGDTSSSTAAAGAPAKEAPAEAVASKDVKIVKSGFEDHDTWGPGAYVVRWSITNSGDEEAGYYAGLDFVDSAGRVLGSTGITADKVGPGSTAKGDIAPLPVEIDKGKITDITGVRVTDVDRTPTP
ncbi:hypothetical protein [Streptomyces sp. NPDC007346]|uniref:hypothetical protein n=1 Tax=Streptomyces sp. NPDC007346 TaxID=3154682 RepID=UPI00345441A6